ncbi:hypothetical protein DIPPA_14884 [Diplonema papillatum]|nr:hypothetical protein DIPPA_14884 [Diplonema papillatum]
MAAGDLAPTPERDVDLLVHCLLRNHGNVVKRTGVPLTEEELAGLAARSLDIPALLRAVDQGGPVQLHKISRHPRSTPQGSAPASSASGGLLDRVELSARDSPPLTSASRTPPLSPRDSGELATPRTEAPGVGAGMPPSPAPNAPGNIFYTPVFTRRCVAADVRPIPPGALELARLKDRVLPALDDRTRAVSLLAYEALLASQGFDNTELIDVQSALELPTVVARGIGKILALAPNGAAPRARVDVMWRYECLQASFEHPAKALECFSGSEQLLEEWRTRTVALLVDVVERSFGEDSPEGLPRLAEDLFLLAKSPSPNAWAGLSQKLEALLSAAAAGQSRRHARRTDAGAQTLHLPVEIAVELYSALVALSIPESDEVDGIDNDELLRLGKNLRETWNLAEEVHGAARLCILSELLTTQGGRDATTAAALARTLRDYPATREAVVSPALTSFILGRVYNLFLAPHRTLSNKPELLRSALSACAGLVSKGQSVAGRRKTLECLQVVVETTGPIHPYLGRPTDDCEEEAGFVNAVVALLTTNAVWYSATKNFLSLVEKAGRQVSEEEDVKICSLADLDRSTPPRKEPKTAGDAAAVPGVVLDYFERELARHDALVAAGVGVLMVGRTKGAEEAIASSARTSYLVHVTDLYLSKLRDMEAGSTAKLDLFEPATSKFFRKLRRAVLAAPRPCKTTVCLLQQLTPVVSPSAERWVHRLQQSHVEYIETAFGRPTWDAAAVLPEVLDVFTCFNENVSEVETIFFPGASGFAKGIAQSISGSTQYLIETLTNRFALTDVPSADVPSLLSRFGGGSAPPKQVAVAINSLVKAEAEYLQTIQRFRSLWSNTNDHLGDPAVTVNAESTLSFFAAKRQQLLHCLAASFVIAPQPETLRGCLYAVDPKHYKKYKHDKKYLSKNGNAAHLRPYNGTTMQAVLDRIDAAMTDALPTVETEEIRMRVVEASLELLSRILHWILLDDSTTEKYGRFYHEEHTPHLIRDLTEVETFYHNGGAGLPHSTLTNCIGPIKLLIQVVMSRPSEELIAGGDLTMPYDSLPEEDPVKPFSKKIVRKVLQHRKDPVAKKFMKRFEKR